MSETRSLAPAALSAKDAAAYVGVSRAQLYRLMEAHGFPKGFFVSERRRVIMREAIDRWLADRAEAHAREEAEIDEMAKQAAARIRKGRAK